MTGTETNMAYRTADHTRWQQLDFVVGQEIHTSNNHTLNGKQFDDMCDSLAGKYPKDFEFTGWHPNCRCYATSILKSREEMREDNRRIMNGLEPLPATASSNYVAAPPQGFNNWLAANKDRIARAKSVPYFIKNNQELVNDILNGDYERKKKIAENRAEYNSYDKTLWKKEFFDEQTGGYVVVDVERAKNASKDAPKNERAKYLKELASTKVFAEDGHRMVMLRERPGVPSPDVTIDGVPADLKQTSSANNIVKYAKKAIRKQGAELVLFELPTMNAEISKELNKLTAQNIHGKYYIAGEKKVHDF